ncbi:MAG: pentapeptide repeat-containing protein, partial [Gammaproteobacteria bacterium]|nr:pentapeptide repeat-containing protein [Gammaproteobacteria bacterium]
MPATIRLRGAEMHFIERLNRWEGILFGFIIGVTATVVGSMAYNEINGLLRVSHLKRSFHNDQLEEIATFLEAELATATTAMKDGQPLEISNYFAFHFMPKLYAHHMDYAMTLLQNEDVTKFNSLRNTTHFLTFNLSQRDFSGLDLKFVNLVGALLTAADFSNAKLEGAD